ncbi:MAG TPA: VCBS repeat-containing protein, partial [Ilumatobacteraceae bacterium]
GCPFKELTTVDIKQYIRVTPSFPPADLPAGYSWTVFSWNPAAGALREWSLDRIKAIPYGNSVQFVDVNGDGLRDIAFAPVLQGAAQGDWKFHLARLTPQFIGAVLSYDAFVSTGLLEQGGVMRSVTVADFDADGREDLISSNVNVTNAQFGLQTMFQRLANGQSQITTREVEPAQRTGYEFRLDINGDGLKDTLYRNLDPARANDAWRIRINTGNGYTAPSQPGNADVVTTFSRMFPETEIVMPNLYKVDSGIRIADLNGDRRDDVIVLALNTDAQVPQGSFGWTAFSARSVRVMYSNGAGFNPPVNIADRGASMGPMAVPAKRWPFQAVADVDGNGLPDLVEFLQSGLTNAQRVLTVHRLPNLQAGTDVITRVRDERGVAADIVMDAISNNTFARFGGGTNVHLPATHVPDVGEACVYPAACTTRGRAVREIRDLRAPRTTQVTYDYKGARVDKHGRGSLGFSTVGTLDSVSGRYTVQRFSQSPQGFLVGGRSLTTYPDITTPRRTEVSFPPTGSFLDLVAITGGRSGTITTWTPTYRAQYPVLKQKTVETTDVYEAPSSARRSNFNTQIDYDSQFPLPVREQKTFTDLVTGINTRETKTTSYTVDATLWLLRRPLNVTVTKETSEDARDTGCTTLPCVSSSVSYDHTYVTGTAELSTRTRRNGSHTLVHRLVRATNGLVTAERDEVGTTIRETQLAYDPMGAYVIGRRTPAGLESWSLRDPTSGWVFAEVDPNGVKTVYTRDGFGRITRTARDDGFVQTMQYSVGRVDGFPNNAGAWSMNYDERGRKSRHRWATFDNRVGDEQTLYASSGQPATQSYGFEGQALA